MSDPILIPIEEAVVTIYEHIDFNYPEWWTGAARTFYDSEPNLEDLGWNDHVSSFIVESGYVQFFEHINYEGESWVFGPGEYSWVEDVGIPNDEISSMLVWV